MVRYKNLMGLLQAVLGLAICFVFRGYIKMQKAVNLINEKIFDAQLITVGDYSVQGQVTGKMYSNFKDICGETENTINKFEVELAK